MIALRSFMRGISTGVQSRGLIVTLYVVNLVIALPAALTFRNIVSSTFGNSMAIDRFLDGLDYADYQEFLGQAGGAMTSYLILIFWILLAYVFVNTLLAGGVLTVLSSGKDRFSLRDFLGGCGRYFGRFFSLAVIFGIMIAITMALVVAILSGIYSLAAGDANSEVTAVVWTVALAIVAAVVLGILLLMLDYAKVIIVRGDLRSIFKAIGRAVAFVTQKFFPIILTAVLVLLAFGLGTVIYLWIEAAVGTEFGLSLAVVFVIQQAYVLYRIFLRVSFYSCELQYHGHFIPHVAEPDAVAATTAQALESR